jgi:mono/diheme cytochrome c family protein
MSQRSYFAISLLRRNLGQRRLIGQGRVRVGFRALLTMGTLALLGAIVIGVMTVRAQETKKVAPKAAAGGQGGAMAPSELVASYKENCAYCHGSDGTGNRIRKGSPSIPDFTSLAWQMSQTDMEIAHRIRDGHEPTMPAYREELSEPQILGLSIYVRAFSIKALGPVKRLEPAAPPTPETDRPATAARMTSSDLYQAYCLACHDAGGRAATVRKAMPEIPDFSDLAWQASRSDAALKHSILQGKGKFMLPMNDKLGGDDADQMVAFLRAFGGGKQLVVLEPRKRAVAPAVATPPAAARAAPDAPKPARTIRSAETIGRLNAVTRLYRQYCLTCHGVDGKGTEMRPSMATLPDFSGRVWQDAKNDEHLVASVLDGNGSLMPAFQGRVNIDQARDLVAYVRAFGPFRTTAAKPPTSDFERRFQQLRQEWDELDKQLRVLSPKPPRAGARARPTDGLHALTEQAPTRVSW